MRHAPLVATSAFVAALLSSSCGSSPATPSLAGLPASGSRPAAPSVAKGRTLDALTGAPLASLTVRLDDGESATTDAGGLFELPSLPVAPCRVTVSGAAVVQRETEIRPREADLSLSLIPSHFDLAAFDQMVRDAGALRRWTAAPSLVVIDAVLQFTAVSASSFTALDERLTAEERAALSADLAWALPQVTGNAFGAFGSVSVESPAPGSAVEFFSREGRIVVARFRGLSQATGYWGYGRAGLRGHEVVAGAVLVDRDFDAGRGPHVRSLRAHELGHALGYCHVTRRQSFMNQSAVYEPNDFDRDAGRIAFQRDPGNQSPDRDPAQVRASRRAVAPTLTWTPITP